MANDGANAAGAELAPAEVAAAFKNRLGIGAPGCCVFAQEWMGEGALEGD